MSTDVQRTNEPGDPGDQLADSSATGSGASCPASDGTGMGIPPRSHSGDASEMVRVTQLVSSRRLDWEKARKNVELILAARRLEHVRRVAGWRFPRHEVIPVPDCNWSWSWLKR